MQKKPDLVLSGRVIGLVGTSKVHLIGGTRTTPIGIDINSLTDLDDEVPTHTLQPFVSTMRPTREQSRSLRRPSITSNYIVQFAPSPQGTTHIRLIAGENQALDLFLATEPQPRLAPTETGVNPPRPIYSH